MMNVTKTVAKTMTKTERLLGALQNLVRERRIGLDNINQLLSKVVL